MIKRLGSRLIAGLIFCSILPAGEVKAQSVSHNPTSNISTQQGAARPQANPPPAIPIAVQNDIHDIASAMETANKNQPSAAEESRAERDVTAQEKMAFWARLMFIVAGIETLITAAGVYLVWRTLIASREAAGYAKRAADAAKRQADAAEGAFTKLERPHLFIEQPRLESNTIYRLSPNMGWAGPFPQFCALYDVINYGRSPAIIKVRCATIFICANLPDKPQINENDVYTDHVAIKSEGDRKGWPAYSRDVLTNEVINGLREGRGPAAGIPRGLKAFLFVRLKYEGVYGKIDEIAAIWEYLIDINSFIPREIENYSYRRLDIQDDG